MWKGTAYRFSLDKHLGKQIDNKTDADAAAEDIEKAIREGTFGRPAPVTETTLQQLVDLYSSAMST